MPQRRHLQRGTLLYHSMQRPIFVCLHPRLERRAPSQPDLYNYELTKSCPQYGCSNSNECASNILHAYYYTSGGFIDLRMDTGVNCEISTLAPTAVPTASPSTAPSSVVRSHWSRHFVSRCCTWPDYQNWWGETALLIFGKRAHGSEQS